MVKGKQPVDLGSEYLDNHFQISLEPISATNRTARRRVVNQRQHDRLAIKGKISHEQWSAAERLTRIAHAAGWDASLESQLAKLVKVDLGSASDSSTLPSVDAGKRLRQVLKEIQEKCGEQSARVVLVVILYDQSPEEAKALVRVSDPVTLLLSGLDCLLSSSLFRESFF